MLPAAVAKQTVETADSCYKKAHKCLCISRYSEAIEFLNKAIRLNHTKLSLIYTFLGYAKTCLNKLEEAEQDFNFTLNIEKNNSSAFCFLGELRRIEADKILRELQHISDEEVKKMALALREEKKKDSKNCYDRAIEFNSENTQAHLFLGIYFSKEHGKGKEAYIHFKKVIDKITDKESKNEFDNLLLSRAYIEISKLEERPPDFDTNKAEEYQMLAFKHLYLAQSQNLDSFAIREVYVYIHFKCKNYDIALALVNKAIDECHIFPDLLNLSYQIKKRMADIAIVEKSEAYKNTKHKDFSLQGDLICLKCSDHMLDGFKADILSKKENLEFLPYLRRTTGWEKSHVEFYWKKYLSVQAFAFDIFAIDNNQLVGCVFIFDIGQTSAELGIIIDNEYWRKGFSNECHLLSLDYCFNQLGLTEMRFGTDKNNKAMRNFYENVCGIQPKEDDWVEYILEIKYWKDLKNILMTKVTEKIRKNRETKSKLRLSTGYEQYNVFNSHVDKESSESALLTKQPDTTPPKTMYTPN